MKIINNKRGSAILWAILMCVILTILLGSLLSACYAYFNYTMYTVKRQQAYFTCRSFIDAVIDTVSNQDESSASDSKLPLPTEDNPTYDITDVKFYSDTDAGYQEVTNMGEIKEATLTYANVKNQDQLTITVTAQYADQEYTITAAIIEQPLYFAGVSIKELTLGTDLNLGSKTDLYYNNTDTLLSQQTVGGKKHNLTVYGNLVTKGDAKIYAGTSIAGHTFDKNTYFNGTGRYKKRIWDSEHYILSNTTLKVIDSSSSEVEYNKNFIKTVSNFTATDYQYCNNNLASRDTSFGSVDIFATLYAMVKDIPGIGDLAGVMFKSVDTFKNYLLNQLSGTELGNILSDFNNSSLSMEDSNTDSNAIRYIKLLSLSNYITQLFKSSDNTIIKYIVQFFEEKTALGQINLKMFDLSYIGYTSTNQSTWSDNVVPVVYLFIDDGLVVRVRYGQDPDNLSIAGQAVDFVEESASSLLSRYLSINNNLAYVIVYLGKGSEIELGCTVNMNLSTRSAQDLIFAYTIYGEEGSKVTINDGVTVIGQVICDDLVLKDPKNEGMGVNIIYSNSNGSQVARQKVGEFWTVAKYVEG